MSTNTELYPDIYLLDMPDGDYRWKCGCGAESAPSTGLGDVSKSAVDHDKSHRAN